MADNTTVVTAEVAPLDERAGEGSSYVDWGAIIGGAVLAAAISVLFLTFGSAIGLTLTSPFDNDGASVTVLAIATALWFLWVQISSFMAGGYFAGRMRRRVWHAAQHEVEVRDGAHGLMVWAVGALVGALFAVSTIASVVEGATRTATTVATASISAAEPAAALGSGTDLEFVADALLRSDADPASAQSREARPEVLRILARSAESGSMAEADKSYLARVVAARTELSEDEANRRVDEILQKFDSAVAQAKEAAEAARKWAIVAAFVTAASLLVSAAGAWWAAGMGGSHRDAGKVFTTFAMWR